MAAIQPAFSVIIPLFNKEVSIADTIKSVLSQSYRDFELIIIDDGSTDESFERASKAIKGVQNTQIIRQENKGVSIARNRGADCAQHKYLTFIDADDLWHPEFLKTMVGAIKQFPEEQWFGVSSKRFTGNELTFGTIGSVSFKPVCYFEASVKRTLQRSIVYTGSFIITKRFFSELGGYPTGIIHFEDYDLYYRAAAVSKIVWANLDLAFYRMDAENQSIRNVLDIEKPPFFDDPDFYKLFVSDEKLYWKQRQTTRLFHDFFNLKIRNWSKTPPTTERLQILNMSLFSKGERWCSYFKTLTRAFIFLMKPSYFRKNK